MIIKNLKCFDLDQIDVNWMKIKEFIHDIIFMLAILLNLR